MKIIIFYESTIFKHPETFSKSVKEPDLEKVKDDLVKQGYKIIRIEKV